MLGTTGVHGILPRALCPPLPALLRSLALMIPTDLGSPGAPGLLQPSGPSPGRCPGLPSEILEPSAKQGGEDACPYPHPIGPLGCAVPAQAGHSPSLFLEIFWIAA